MEVRQQLNLSSDLLVVREETYQQKKALLRRFLAGFRDSAQWMRELRLFGMLADKAWGTMPVPGGTARPRPASDDAQQIIFMP